MSFFVMLNMFSCSRPVPIFFAFLSIFEHWKLFTYIHPSSPNFASLYERSLLPNPGCIGYRELKSFSDVVLSQQPSPKNYLQKFLSLILTNLDQIHRDLLKITKKKFFVKICVIRIFSLNSKKQGLYIKEGLCLSPISKVIFHCIA